MLSGLITIDLLFYSEKQCPHLSDPSNGEVVVMSALVGGEAMYFCDNGYKLNGVSSRKCQSDETWSGSEPSCDCKINREEIVTIFAQSMIRKLTRQFLLLM